MRNNKKKDTQDLTEYRMQRAQYENNRPRSNTEQYPERYQEPIRQSEPDLPGEPIIRGREIVSIVFFALYMAELYLCYTWLIQPILPIIMDIVANHGVPTIQIYQNSDVLHPIGMTISGYKGMDVYALLIDTVIRIGVFSLMFTVTSRIHRILKRRIR